MNEKFVLYVGGGFLEGDTVLYSVPEGKTLNIFGYSFGGKYIPAAEVPDLGLECFVMLGAYDESEPPELVFERSTQLFTAQGSAAKNPESFIYPFPISAPALSDINFYNGGADNYGDLRLYCELVDAVEETAAEDYAPTILPPEINNNPNEPITP